MSEEYIENAIIESVQLTIERGSVVAFLQLRFGESGGQGFGGYCLYNPNFPDKDYTGFWIYRCCESVGAETWEALVGKPCRVKKESYLSDINAIGHFLEDKWFYPKKELKEKTA